MATSDGRWRRSRPGIGTRICGDCGVGWPARRARFCGRCGAALTARAGPEPQPTAGRRAGVLAGVGTAVVAAALIVALPGLSDLRSGTRLSPGGRGVELPTAPPMTAEPQPRPRADTPPVPVRCRTADRCVRWRLPSTPAGAGTPVVTDLGHLVAVTSEGLAGFDVATGEHRWDMTIDGPEPVTATLAVVEGAKRLVLLVGPAEHVSILDAESGTRIWEQQIAGAYAARAARSEPHGLTVAVRVRAEDGLASAVAVLGVDTESGEVRWRRDAASAALTSAGAVLQDTEGVLSGLAPADGTTRWTRQTRRPAAPMTALGSAVLASARDAALVIDAASGELREEVAQPSSTLLTGDGVVLWGDGERLDYLDGDGGRWTTPIARLAGCCSGFAADVTTVTVLTGRSEFVRLDRRTGELIGREMVPAALEGTAGRAWLRGPHVVVSVPGAPGDLGQVHDATTGAHLADVTGQAYGLARAGAGHWLVLAPELAITLSPPDQQRQVASGLGPARPRTR